MRLHAVFASAGAPTCFILPLPIVESFGKAFLKLYQSNFLYLLIRGEESYCCPWSHNGIHLVGPSWTWDRPVAETWQQTTLTRNKHSCPRLDSNPQSQPACGRRPHALDCTATEIGRPKCVFFFLFSASSDIEFAHGRNSDLGGVTPSPGVVYGNVASKCMDHGNKRHVRHVDFVRPKV